MTSLENDRLTIVVMATTLQSKYDEWSKDEKIMDVLDVEKNSLCIQLKNLYPHSEKNVIQSIALSFFLYLYTLVLGSDFKNDNYDDVIHYNL